MNDEHESTLPADSSVLDDLRRLAAEARAEREVDQAQAADADQQAQRHANPPPAAPHPQASEPPPAPAQNQGGLDALAQLAGQGRSAAFRPPLPPAEEAQPSGPLAGHPSVPSSPQPHESTVVDLSDLAQAPDEAQQKRANGPQRPDQSTVGQPVSQQLEVDLRTTHQAAAQVTEVHPTLQQSDHVQQNGEQGDLGQHDSAFDGVQVDLAQPDVQRQPLRAPQPTSNWTPPARMVMPTEPERSTRSSSRPWRFLVAVLAVIIVALVAVVIYLTSLQLLGSTDSDQPADGESSEVDDLGETDGL